MLLKMEGEVETRGTNRGRGIDREIGRGRGIGRGRLGRGIERGNGIGIRGVGVRGRIESGMRREMRRKKSRSRRH